MMPLFLWLLALPTILFLHFQTQKSKHAKKHHPPAPRALPFVGNLHQVDDGRHTSFHRLSKKYGPVMSLKLGSRRAVVISSADAVKEIMKSHDAVFSSRPVLATLQRLSYSGLGVGFSPYNNEWREMKKISTIHLFSRKQVESFRPIFRDEVSKMMKKFAMDASSSNVTNLTETTMSFSSNIICRVAFGKSYGDDGYGKNRFFDLLHGIVLADFFIEDFFPSLRWIDTLSGRTAKLDKSFREMDSFCQELIEEHITPNRPKTMDGDIIDILLQIKSDGSTSFHLTFDHIKALIVDIIIGGSETSSALLVWAMTALMKKPLLMKKVQAEIRQLVGKKDMVDEHDIEKVPYLKAVVKETLRLFPPGPLLIPRETIARCSVNGYEIESGTTVYINAWAIGRDPATWENADEFVPERFLGSELDVRGQNPEVIPFGIGRRGCPGIGIAMAEVELALANVLYKFEWALPDGMKEDDIDLEFTPGLAMKKKIALRLVPSLVLGI